MAFFDLFFIVELVMSLVVMGACVGLIVGVPVSRPYAGIGLGVAIIYITRAWRILPSNREYVKNAVGKAADDILRKRAQGKARGTKALRHGNRLPRSTERESQEPFAEHPRSQAARSVSQPRVPPLQPSLLFDEQQHQVAEGLQHQQPSQTYALLSITTVSGADYHSPSTAPSPLQRGPLQLAPPLYVLPPQHSQTPQVQYYQSQQHAHARSCTNAPFAVEVTYTAFDEDALVPNLGRHRG